MYNIPQYKGVQNNVQILCEVYKSLSETMIRINHILIVQKFTSRSVVLEYTNQELYECSLYL